MKLYPKPEVSEERKQVIARARPDVSMFIARTAAKHGLSMGEIALLVSEEAAFWALQAAGAEASLAETLVAMDTASKRRAARR